MSHFYTLSNGYFWRSHLIYTYYQELPVFLLTVIKKFTFPLGTSQQLYSEAASPVGGGGGVGGWGVLGLIFAGYLPRAPISL